MVTGWSSQSPVHYLDFLEEVVPTYDEANDVEGRGSRDKKYTALTSDQLHR